MVTPVRPDAILQVGGETAGQYQIVNARDGEEGARTLSGFEPGLGLDLTIGGGVEFTPFPDKLHCIG